MKRREAEDRPGLDEWAGGPHVSIMDVTVLSAAPETPPEGEAQDLYALETLRGAAEVTGLDADELQRAIEEGTSRPAVEESVREAQELGIHAVPTFVFDDRRAVQGAQELPVFRRVMERVTSASSSLLC